MLFNKHAPSFDHFVVHLKVILMHFWGDLRQEVSTPASKPKFGRREALHDTSVVLQAVLSILGWRDFSSSLLGAVFQLRFRGFMQRAFYAACPGTGLAID